MGVSGRWCLKLLLLVTLLPLALRAATSLLLIAAPPPSHIGSGRSGGDISDAYAAAASAARSPHGRPHRQTRHRRRIESSLVDFDGSRHVDADCFEDDKRLAPTGSNPLHNLR